MTGVINGLYINTTVTTVLGPTITNDTQASPYGDPVNIDGEIVSNGFLPQTLLTATISHPTAGHDPLTLLFLAPDFAGYMTPNAPDDYSIVFTPNATPRVL